MFILYSRFASLIIVRWFRKTKNVKFHMIRTLIFYSRSASWIIGRWVRYTPTQNTWWFPVYFAPSLRFVDHSSLGPMLILHSRFASLIIVRWFRKTPTQSTWWFPRLFCTLALLRRSMFVRKKKHPSGGKDNNLWLSMFSGLVWKAKTRPKHRTRQGVVEKDYDYSCFQGCHEKPKRDLKVTSAGAGPMKTTC